MIPCLTANAAQEMKLDTNVEYVKSNETAKDLLYEKVKKEEENIKKNRVLLHDLEISLTNAVENGIVEKEKCIRDNISALRTINHVYNWMMNQIDSMNYAEMRLSTIESFDRIKYLNKLFTDINYRVNDCYFKNVKPGIVVPNEITKYAIDNRSGIIKQGLDVPEEYQAARSPFR